MPPLSPGFLLPPSTLRADDGMPGTFKEINETESSMYLVYLRHVGGGIVGKVEHPSSREEAEQCFARLVNDTSYDGFDLLAVLVEHKELIAIHRFKQPAGQGQSWRGRLNKIPFSSLH
jgi:hypothetical protein